MVHASLAVLKCNKIYFIPNFRRQKKSIVGSLSGSDLVPLRRGWYILLYQHRGAAAWLLYSSPSRSGGCFGSEGRGLARSSMGCVSGAGVLIGKTWESVRRFLCLLIRVLLKSEHISLFIFGRHRQPFPPSLTFADCSAPYTSRRLCGSLRGACRWGYNFMGRGLAALCACAGRSAGGIKQQHKKRRGR